MAKRKPTEQAEQLAILAAAKAFPYRTIKLAEDMIAEGQSRRICATIKVEGELSRGMASEQSASAGPLQEAMLAMLARGLDRRALAAKRRAALKAVKAAAAEGCSVGQYLASKDPAFTALINDIKALAASDLEPVKRRGSLKFAGSAVVAQASC